MKKTLVRWKIYTDRARWYMGYVSMIISIITLLKVSGVSVIWWHIPILFFVIVFLFIIIGYIEVKLGTLKEEQKKYSEENPILQEILEEIKKLK